MGSAEAAVLRSPDSKTTTLPPEQPAVPATPPVPPTGNGLASDRFDGGVLVDPQTSGSEGDVLGGEDEDSADDEALGSDDEDDEYDSDFEFEEDDDEPLDQFGDGKAASSARDDLILAPVEFLGGPARFAAVDSTAGFMLLRAGSADAGQDAAGEITVHYRYVRFTRQQDGGPGVEVFGGAKLHPVRFLVPNLADPASYLRLAGAALADMVYPRRFTAQLQALWTNLVAAAPVRVPPRVEVTVSVGILRRGDRTPERMAAVRAALADTACDADARPFLRNVGMVMRLLAPVSVEDFEDEDNDDGARPTKRRRLADTEEECAICHEALERGLLAAWPQCSHVFHCACCEQLLVSGHQRCPLCRTELSHGLA